MDLRVHAFSERSQDPRGHPGKNIALDYASPCSESNLEKDGTDSVSCKPDATDPDAKTAEQIYTSDRIGLFVIAQKDLIPNAFCP